MRIRPFRLLALSTAVVVCAAAWTWAFCSLAATPDEMRLMQRVNGQVNRAITYQTDQDQYGMPERWVAYPASGRGDCEDYAFTKAEELKRLGFAAHRLRVRLDVTDERGSRHAVLIVDGEWILDNRFQAVERIDRMRWLGYGI